MIYGYLHQGSGVGNQLFRMLATRMRALDLGMDWRMVWNPDNSGKTIGFKCKDFMEFDVSKMIIPERLPNDLKIWNEKQILDKKEIDIRGFDPDYFFVEDNTLIDGEFQDERYWEHREKEVDEWLKVEHLEMPDDLCVIGFRGGEFQIFLDLFLPKSYWDEGIKRMKEINPNMRFEVHTDDEILAARFFPDYKVIHDVGINWRSCRYARYAIIANSSFFILPRWLNKGITIAPRFWARRNVGIWSLPQNYYKRWTYI